MRKKRLGVILAVCLAAGVFAGCGQTDNAVGDKNTAPGTEPKAPPVQICSLCETETACGSYEVDGWSYLVCDDCYNEFATAFEIPRECSLCEKEKVCYGYTVEGQTYIVCNDCYGEFATAFDLTQLCGHCEEEKLCAYYTVDGVVYVVCDDCYDEFAEGFGLK